MCPCKRYLTYHHKCGVQTKITCPNFARIDKFLGDLQPEQLFRPTSDTQTLNSRMAAKLLIVLKWKDFSNKKNVKIPLKIILK